MFSFLIPLLDTNKIIIASVTSVVFFVFACLTLAVSAVALAVCTPLFIIFSPILVPATIATTLLATGLTAGATLGLVAIGLIIGLIKTAEGTPLALSAQGTVKLPFKFVGGFWKFSGTFGDVLKWLKKQPWFKLPPAAGAAPPPAADAAPPPADGAAPPPAAGAAPPPAAGAAPPPAAGAAPPTAPPG